ncbi:MAG TPA: Lrp/AsnC family transcriptional regulator [Planctomycetota bacterium]|nr:Lrp/AsnC family transcriptional regulator [Planctomycetota bacterium]
MRTRPFELDDVDRRILDLLQRDNRMKVAHMAAAVHVSAPTCLRRIRRLREAGVIVADVSLVDPSFAGRGLTVFIEVMLEHHTEKEQAAFERQVAGVSEITQCYMVSGEIDFLLVAQVADLAALDRLLTNVLSRNPNLRKSRSHFALHRAKFETMIPFGSATAKRKAP